MSVCASCGASLTDDRPTRRIVLEIEDRTRSTKQFMGDETDIKRLHLNRELCEQCWSGYSEKLSQGERRN